MAVSGLDHLRVVIADMRALAGSTPHADGELADDLKAIYTGLFLVDFEDYDAARVKVEAEAVVADLFAAQLAIRDQIGRWAAGGLMSRPVQGALRDVFRVARYARDLIGEIGLGHVRLADGEAAAPAFGGPAVFTDINPRLAGEGFELQPGDVILQRGMAHNSAAIARIGDVDSQFSHVAIVARDDGRPVIVEALIEDGAVVTPLDEALAHAVGRAIVFRHHDAYLAERASELIRDHVKAANARKAPGILYDFTMQPEEYNRLFCANLVRLAFSMASTAEVQLPTYATMLDMRNRDFLQRIGVTARQTFAPGDLELEPDFDVVAEWRDYRITSELRLKDMIMTKLFEWMELYDYNFRPTLWIRFLGFVGRLSTKLPSWVQKWGRKSIGKVPPNMSARAVGAIAMLHLTAEALYDRLREHEERSIATNGRQLHPRVVLELLERWRGEMGRRIGYLRR